MKHWLKSLSTFCQVGADKKTKTKKKGSTRPTLGRLEGVITIKLNRGGKKWLKKHLMFLDRKFSVWWCNSSFLPLHQNVNVLCRLPPETWKAAVSPTPEPTPASVVHVATAGGPAARNADHTPIHFFIYLSRNLTKLTVSRDA